MSLSSLRVGGAFLLSGALLTGAAGMALAQSQTFNNIRLNGTVRPFQIENAPATVRAGTPITFNAVNAGPVGDTSAPNTHNLAIDGNGVDLKPTTPNLTGGQSGTITFAALQPGTYHLYCPVGQHRANGMDVTFTVVAGASALPATGGFVVPGALGAAGIAAAGAGMVLRRRK